MINLKATLKSEAICDVFDLKKYKRKVDGQEEKVKEFIGKRWEGEKKKRKMTAHYAALMAPRSLSSGSE